MVRLFYLITGLLIGGLSAVALLDYDINMNISAVNTEQSQNTEDELRP